MNETLENRLLENIKRGEEVLWLNHKMQPFAAIKDSLPVSEKEVAAAAQRLKRFAPLIMHCFPETAGTNGILESPLTEVPTLLREFNSKRTGDAAIQGRLFLKRDSELPVSGSVKSRGGIYEVLKHTEELGLAEGILSDIGDDYLKLVTEEARSFFAGKKLQVGSTGNLGVSIGLMGAAIGYKTIVHMSEDAKDWKKALLREHGVQVVEYAGDYSSAVRQGRAESQMDPDSYFVDDETSCDLFYGYAVAGERLASQLAQLNIAVDAQHPLFVYIPCGVGGAPCGVAYGLKLQFGDSVHVFFAEPTEAPCMLAGLATGRMSEISVQELGLSGRTIADGLAVGRCSSLAAEIADQILSGEATVKDCRLTPWLRQLYADEGFFVEPSACAAVAALLALPGSDYIRKHKLEQHMADATHILWATGGSLVPSSIREMLLKEHEA